MHIYYIGIAYVVMVINIRNFSPVSTLKRIKTCQNFVAREHNPKLTIDRPPPSSSVGRQPNFFTMIEDAGPRGRFCNTRQ